MSITYGNGLAYMTHGFASTGTAVSIESPDVGDVRLAVEYGDGGDEFTGTLVLPAASTVLDGIGYGEDGTEFEGTLEPGTSETPSDNLLKQASNWLEAERKTHMTELVTYVRDANEVEVYATFGKTDFELTDESGVKVGGAIIDFLFTKLDLVLDSAVITPRYGDLIETENQGNYEVMHIPGQGVSRESDSFNQTVRVHTKQVT